MVALMKRALLSFLLLCVPLFPALAQQDASPLTIEGANPVPLAGAGQASAAQAGDVYLLSFALRNRSSDPVWLRRLALRLPSGLEIVDPNFDRIDNDRDGAVDEGDEAATDSDESSLAWRGIPTDPPLAPGEAAERAVKVRIRPEAEAGSSQVMEIFAAVSNGDLAIRSEQAVGFSVVPASLEMMMSGGKTLRVDETPKLEASLFIPSGRIDDLSLTMKSSSSIAAYRNARVEMGEGIMCDGKAVPETGERRAQVSLGRCVADPSTSRQARTIRFLADAELRDADPFAGPNVINAARAVSIGAVAASGERPLGGPRVVGARIVGPLLGARLIDAPESRVDAGDAFRVKYRLVNRGNESARNMVLSVMDDGRISCGSLVLDNGSRIENACETGVPLASLPPGELRDVSFSLSLRNDARFRGKPALQASLSGDAMRPARLPDAPYELRLPPPPTLRLLDGGEWQIRDGLVTSRIGDRAVIKVTGTLPEGRYQAIVRLLSRLVDAQTGEPLGPAPLLVESFQVSASSAQTSDTAPVVRQDDGWSVAFLPLSAISIPAGADKADKRYSALVSTSLRDLPEAEAGRIIEITAELDLFGSETVRGDSWIEALIIEPALDLTVRSPDEDRAIELDSSVGVAALTCNRGLAAAHALVLGAHIPSGLVVDESAESYFVRLPIDRIHDTESLFATRNPGLGEIAIDRNANVIRGVLAERSVLPPETCAALMFAVRRSGQYDANAALAKVVATVEPFKGSKGPRARVYPGISSGELRLTLPPVRFGPVSETEVGLETIIAHVASLEIPPDAGPYRVDLKTESTAGLDWTILQLDEDGAARPWRDNSLIDAGETLRLRFEAPRPAKLPLGWVDMTLVRALVISSGGDPISVSTRLESRKDSVPGGRITVRKLLALDRDCDGEVDDERVQDALFEPVKDAAIGDCVIFRIAFRHAGDKSMEQIVLRDQVPPGTELRADAVEILRTPEPLQNAEILPPKPGERAVVWRFDGLFEPGAEGEVSYEVRLTGTAPDATR